MNSKGDKKSFGNFQDEFAFDSSFSGVDEIDNGSKVIDRDLASYPESVKEEVYRRYDYVIWFQKRLHAGWTKKNIIPLLVDAEKEIGKSAPSWRTLAAWWKLYKDSNFNIAGLIPKHFNKGNSFARTTESEQKIFDDSVERYLIPQRPSVAAVYQYYRDRIVVVNQSLNNQLVPISYQAYLNRINQLPPYEVMKMRYGKHRADIEFNAIGTHIPIQRVLERVEIDHTPLDIILLDDEYNIPLGRAYLTLLIDAYSRCVVGFHIGYRDPSYYSIKMALLNAMKRKDSVCERFSELKNDWPCYGKIETLVVDNGAEFWSKNLEYACAEIGTSIQYNPVKKPWLKPLVERMYRTINQQLLINLKGKTFSNILEKENYNSLKDAVLKFSTFIEVFHRWIIDVYHMDANSRFKNIPYWSWIESVKKLPPLPLSEEDQQQLEIVLAQTDYREHRRGGIHIHNLRYDSDELASYRKYHTKKRGLGEQPKLLVKTDPDDLSSINVYIEKYHGYLSVPCVDSVGYTKGLSLQQHKIHCRLHREFIRGKLDLVSLAEVRLSLAQRIQEEEESINKSNDGKTKQLAKLARHQNINSSGNGTVMTNPLEDELAKINDNGDELLDDEDWEQFVERIKPYDPTKR